MIWYCTTDWLCACDFSHAGQSAVLVEKVDCHRWAHAVPNWFLCWKVFCCTLQPDVMDQTLVSVLKMLHKTHTCKPYTCIINPGCQIFMRAWVQCTSTGLVGLQEIYTFYVHVILTPDVYNALSTNSQLQVHSEQSLLNLFIPKNFS